MIDAHNTWNFKLFIHTPSQIACHVLSWNLLLLVHFLFYFGESNLSSYFRLSLLHLYLTVFPFIVMNQWSESDLTCPLVNTSWYRQVTWAGVKETEELSHPRGKQVSGTPGWGGGSTARLNRSRKGWPAQVKSGTLWEGLGITEVCYLLFKAQLDLWEEQAPARSSRGQYNDSHFTSNWADLRSAGLIFMEHFWYLRL